jgi:hypothetical protein
MVFDNFEKRIKTGRNIDFEYEKMLLKQKEIEALNKKAADFKAKKKSDKTIEEEYKKIITTIESRRERLENLEKEMLPSTKEKTSATDTIIKASKLMHLPSSRTSSHKLDPSSKRESKPELIIDQAMLEKVELERAPSIFSVSSSTIINPYIQAYNFTESLYHGFTKIKAIELNGEPQKQELFPLFLAR